MSNSVEVRVIGEDYGVGTYALRPFRPGDILLQELPVVFTESPTSPCCCRGCGMMLGTLAEECRRLASLVEFTALQREEQPSCLPVGANNINHNNINDRRRNRDSSDGEMVRDDCTAIMPCRRIICSSETLYDTLKEFDASGLFFAGVSMDDHATTQLRPNTSENDVRFCTVECRKRYLQERGGKFLLHISKDAETGREIRTGATHDLQAPSASSIMREGHTLTEELIEMVWTSRSDILRTLEYLAQHYNERLRLILSLLSRCLHDTLTGLACDAHVVPLELVQNRFTDVVEGFVLQYTEGAARSLTVEQRAFLRFSWKCVCRWLTLSCMEEEKSIYANGCDGVSQFGWISLQLYLRCFWLADANVHMYVVVSPLYTLLCQRLPTMHAICHRNNNNNNNNNNNSNNSSGDFSRQRLHHQMCVLRELFRVVDPNAAHATGVALYNLATKINHSCTPSVRFVPTHSGVRAVVVALRDIAIGEEVRTSYIDVNAYDSVAGRREYLRLHYGFICDCPLCSYE